MGTDTGELILLENGDFRTVLPQSPLNEGPIDCIQAYSKVLPNTDRAGCGAVLCVEAREDGTGARRTKGAHREWGR